MRLLDYIFAARPMLQLPIWTVYLVALHYHHELSGESFGWQDVVLMACISLFFSAASYLNQVYDYESDRINDKVGFLQKGFLTHGQMLAGFVIASVLPFLAAPFFGMATWFVFGQFLLLAYIYSAPPLRLKDRPIGGLLANSWGHGLLVAIAIMPDLSIHNAGLLGWDNPFYFFFAVGATYIVTTVPDIGGDAATGKKTLAVWIGQSGALAMALVFTLISGWFAWRSAHALLVYVSLFAAMFTLASLVTRSPSLVRFTAKAPLLILTIMACVWYPGYAVFVVGLLIVTRIYYLRRFGIMYPQLA